MAEPQSEDDGLLREWAPLSGFLREVPLTVRRGLFLETVALTCIDAVPEYLAVGTNIGVVYWYHRETHNMQRLRVENKTLQITSVKLVSSVDYMVAAGDESGTVTVFRIPKPTPDWVNPAYKQNSSTNSVERYTVGGLHSSAITSLEWSTNGQKLFSGDSTGLVVLTEIDFYMNLSKACEVLNEKYRIVQLSFHQGSQALVVATEYRCIVAHRQPDFSSWRVMQVGQQERKSLSRVGATFFPHPQRPMERIIYSGRAGLRFWQADPEGFVHKTLIFKEAIKKPHQHMRLLQPPPLKDTSWDGDLGSVLVWQGLYLVTFNSSALVVLNPHDISVVASLCGLSGLHSVSVTPTELFIIAGSRNIMRLSYVPDAHAVSGKHDEFGLSLLDLKVPPVTDTWLNFTSKLKHTASQIVNSRPPTAVSGSVEEDVTTGTDALEFDLPPILPIEIDLPPVLPTKNNIQELTVLQEQRIQILDQIGKESFDDILFSSTRKVRGKSGKQSKSNNSSNGLVSGLESNSDTLSVTSVKSKDSSGSEPNTRPPSRNNNNHPDSGPLPHRLSLDLVSSSHHLCGEIPPDILPDLRSPDSILRDVRDKEILVAKAFNLEEILLSEEKFENKSDDNQKTCSDDQPRQEGIGYGPPSGSSSAVPSLEPSHPAIILDINLETGDGKEHDLVTSDSCDKSCLESTWAEWTQVQAPESAQYLSVCQDFVCMSGPGRTIHASPLSDAAVSWQRLGYRAVDLALSTDGQLVWKLDFGVAAALTDTDAPGPLGGSWEVAARGVASVALSNGCAWYVSAGKVYLQTELSRQKPFRDSCLVPCPVLISKICCSHSMVWVLTADSCVLSRAGITHQCVEGTHWLQLNLPSHIEVADIALGPHSVGWLIDQTNSIYFSDNYNNQVSDWWQVLIGNYLYENTSLCQITSNNTSVWVTNRIDSFVCMNSTVVKGHRWLDLPIKNLTVPLRWRQITAEGVFEDKGLLWLLSSANDLFHIRPNSDFINVVALPCRAEDVSSVTAAPHALWLLTHSGQIHVRQGMGDQCPEGDKWRTLNLEQINDKQVMLRHVSCGCDVIWACDSRGDMYMAVGSPYLIATDTFSPAWVLVEGRPLPSTYFTKVFVGSETHIVWAVDNKNNTYVRSGIFHDFQLGTDWVLVPGVQASELSISGSVVWALSTTGSVFCRLGISQNNYIGNYWEKVPGTLCHLTASVSEGQWGVMDKTGSLVVHSLRELTISEAASQAVAAMYDKYDDWEVI